MHKEPTGQTIQQLQQAGHSLREISRLLGLSRNSVRKLSRQKQAEPAELIHAKHEPKNGS